MDKSFSTASKGIMVTAALVIIIAGMKQAAPVLVPFLLSVFIAVLCFPAMHALQKKGVHEGLSLLLVILMVLIVGGALAMLVGSSMEDFYRDLPEYQAKLTGLWSGLHTVIVGYGITIPADYFNSNMDPKAAMNLATSILGGFGNVLADSFLILLTVIFILLEAGSFSKKVAGLSAPHNESEFGRAFTSKLRTYMGIKTWMSLVTGLVVTLWLWLLGVDYPQLWGVMAFMLNYVPNIGSIIAAVPAVLLALVQLGSMTALLVVAGYAVINVVIGSIIEPRFLGKGLGLSTLVVFISLVFWGWVLGPVGMLLSVPLTVTVKLAIDSHEKSHWIGELLGSGE